MSGLEVKIYNANKAAYVLIYVTASKVGSEWQDCGYVGKHEGSLLSERGMRLTHELKDWAALKVAAIIEQSERNNSENVWYNPNEAYESLQEDFKMKVVLPLKSFFTDVGRALGASRMKVFQDYGYDEDLRNLEQNLLETVRRNPESKEGIALGIEVLLNHAEMLKRDSGRELT